MNRRKTTRRTMLKQTAAGVIGSACALPHGSGAAGAEPAANPLPRWRGFNLLDFFQAKRAGEWSAGRVREDDLRWIRDWGFDFVRLPMDYWLWIDSDWRTTGRLRPDDVFKIKESMLERVDRAVDLCGKYGIHLSLNFHRAPGYCINDPDREPFVLWRDRKAQDAFVHHWTVFAERYRGVSAKRLSFNLVNEAPRPRPGYMTRNNYVEIMTRATRAIRSITPDRIVIVDGLNVGNVPVDELIPLGVAQSVHGYSPAGVSHYRAAWVDKNGRFPKPTWPLKDARDKVVWDRARLQRHYAPWGKLVARGVGVHCGECGGYNKTPHPVFLAWMTDVLDILQQHRIGWALWNFRGSFGVLDSNRADVSYEKFHGHQLDRRLLALLQRH